MTNPPPTHDSSTGPGPTAARDARPAEDPAAELVRLRARNAELEQRLRFANERGQELLHELQKVLGSPTWQLLVRLDAHPLAGGVWRMLKRAAPVRLKEAFKRGLRRGAAGPSAGLARAAESGLVWGSEPELIDGLEQFLTRVADSDAGTLAVFVSGVKFVASEGQRVTQMTRELVRHGVPVLMIYHRWAQEHGQAVPRPHDERFFQLPIDVFARHRRRLIERPLRAELRRACIFEFPHPVGLEWVNEFNLAGWKTVYDVIDDWEAFHATGNAPWYEPAIEPYLCANCNAVTTVVPRLARKVKTWVPGRSVEVVPNGVAPESFDLTRPAEPTPRGAVTAGYFGYLSRAWFRWELIAECARQRPTWEFHIIGYGEPAPKDLPGNVRLLGRVPHEHLSGFAKNWDVGLVPFDAGPLSQGADPIKVYEYLFLGLPVVAADLEHLRGVPGVRTAGDSAEEWLAEIERSARTPLDDAARAYVAQSTWLARGLALLAAAERGTWNTTLPGAVGRSGA